MYEPLSPKAVLRLLHLNRLESSGASKRLRAQQRGRHDVAREVRGGKRVLLEGVQPAHASFVPPRGSRPAPPPTEQRLCRSTMLQRTASNVPSILHPNNKNKLKTARNR